MRFLGQKKLFDSIPSARRAGEKDVVYFDGGKIKKEKGIFPV
jgi:hypothetical protein